ncbi:MAG: hypothetical protein ACI9VR_003149 [Cognaticolwellia sp.]
MLLLLLSCVDGSNIDSVGAPDFPELPVQWRQAELRCEGTQTRLSAWTTGPGSTAALTAAGTVEDGSAVQADVSLVMSSQDQTSSVQSWSYSGALEELPCPSVSTWRLVLRDARGEVLHCLNQEQASC